MKGIFHFNKAEPDDTSNSEVNGNIIFDKNGEAIGITTNTPNLDYEGLSRDTELVIRPNSTNSDET